jgi:hypothetical protein
MPSGVYKHKLVSKETKKKISVSMKKFQLKGDKSKYWKGDTASYWGIHKWIIRNWGKPNVCEYCKRKDKKAYHWANIDHKYSREKKYWIRLCQSCHIKWDIENNNRVNNYI